MSEVTPSRFDYVAYDDIAKEKQAKLKAAAQKVEAAMYALGDAQDEFDSLICLELQTSLAEADESAADKAREELAESGISIDSLQRLEQAYMWCGKAIRDEQIERNGSAPLLEERGQS